MREDKILVNGEWVDGQPEIGQLHRIYYNGQLVQECVHIRPTKEEEARIWRDDELNRTDLQSLLSDHTKKAALLQYRQALRDWPSSPDFPDNKPVLGE